MKYLTDKAQEFYSRVGGTEGATTEHEKEALAIIRDLLHETDEHALDFATEEFFRKGGGFDMQAEVGGVLGHHTDIESAIYSISNSQQLIVLSDNERLGSGGIYLHAKQGTRRRLQIHDFFMAVIEGRTDEESRSFASDWLGAVFNDDGSVSFDEDDYEYSPDHDFWSDMRDVCVKYEYDKNCYVG